MATIHLGRMIGPSGFSRTVAIKKLHEQFAYDAHFISDLVEEAKLSARIGHPNVVPTLDVVTSAEEVLLVMEYVHGASLAQLIRAAGERGVQVPVPVAVSVMASALHGLHAAHEAKSELGAPLNIVHRDISPQNIMVGADGVTRVLDFGIAKAAGRFQHTQTGQLKGKLSYMAPEQVSSEPVDRRTDVFAAAVVLWELLTCKRLFGAENEAATLGKLLVHPIEPPSKLVRGLSPSLDAIVLRGLSRAPADRYATAREMALALEAVVPAITATATSEWVMSLAADALSDRAKRVREVESISSTGDSSSIAPRALEIQEVPTAVPTTNVGETVLRRLTAYLGPHTAKVAVKTFAQKAVGRKPEGLTVSDLPALQASLRPMLRTFIGRAECERVLDEIARDVRRTT
jgi:eukaryotic-like serine/threonine-protein kinase